MASKITLGTFANVVANLIDEQGLDAAKIQNGVNSALGELAQDGDSKTTGKANIKLSKSEDEGDSFTLKQKEVTNFKGLVSPGRMFFYFNQEMIKLEKVCPGFELTDWPMQLHSWIQKMKKAA